MRATIRRLINPDAEKTSPCAMCGEIARKNKSLFEVDLPCGYKAEVKICRPCSGEFGKTRTDSIELPYLGPHHFHLLDHKARTFWDYADVMAWIKGYMQSPTPVEDPSGVWSLSLHQDFKVFLCRGQPVAKSADNVA